MTEGQPAPIETGALSCTSLLDVRASEPRTRLSPLIPTVFTRSAEFVDTSPHHAPAKTEASLLLPFLGRVAHAGGIAVVTLVPKQNFGGEQLVEQTIGGGAISHLIASQQERDRATEDIGRCR
jgi:hypothetical protein